MSKYYEVNGIKIVEVPVKDFSVVMTDKPKKSSGKNTANAGFFGNFHEEGKLFTLPAAHIVCDFEATDKWTKFYCDERGEFNGKKFTFDASTFNYMNNFYKKAVSTLTVSKGKADIIDLVSIPDGLDYAISGVPIMRNGNDIKFNNYVTSQGWSGGSLYGTWHTFLGLKKDRSVIYVMGMKTKTSNMVLSAEAYKKFKAIDMVDVIKLDGGGSFYFNVDGEVTATSGNRRINSIVRFGDIEEETKNEGAKNPYKVPTSALKYKNKNKEGNKWLQWELNYHGYKCDIDGSFGPDTLAKLKAFQKDHGLEVDGSCGPLTRKELLKH